MKRESRVIRNREYARARMRKRRRKKRIRRLLTGLVVFAGVLGGCMYGSYQGRVYSRCVFEAGAQIQAEDFLKDSSKDIAFAKNSSGIDTSVPGEYTVELKSGIFTYTSKVTVEDTVAPTAEAVDVYFQEGQTVEPEEFVDNIKDVTKVKADYVTKPDFQKTGKQKVEVVLTDEGNNETIISAYLISRVTVKELTVEAGDEFPQIEKFLSAEAEDVHFITLEKDIDMTKPGSYDVKVSANDMEYTTVLKVKDTKSPEVRVKNIEAYTTDKLTGEDFVRSAEDATKLSYSFVKAPNMSETGEQKVIIKVTDAGGNSVEKEASLTVKEDTEPPVIKGAEDFTAYLGDSISYKSGVKVTDNHDKKVTLKVDSSQVKVGTAGEYPVTYTATDSAGNKTSKTVTVTLKKKEYTQEAVDRLADKVLKRIITSDMSQKQKLKAIYNWTRGNIAYTGHADKDDWIKAACLGLSEKKGDCYTYACVAKALLTRAGIQNKDIVKIPARTKHYWNLVDIGEGWYHFDATPRKGQKISFCYISDKDLMEYSKAHNNSHNYDKSVYTGIQ